MRSIPRRVGATAVLAALPPAALAAGSRIGVRLTGRTRVPAPGTEGS